MKHRMQRALTWSAVTVALAAASYVAYIGVTRRRPDERALPRPLLAQMRALGWGLLAELPGREIVVGAVTQPWAADVVFRALRPDEFAVFDEPGYVKIAWTLRADPRGAAASMIATKRGPWPPMPRRGPDSAGTGPSSRRA